MKLPYDNVRDAEMRLSDTIIMIAGEPVYVKGITRGLELIYNRLGVAEDKVVDYNKSSDIDLTPVKLGFINVRGQCSYIARVPSRKQKQGLCVHSIASTTLNPGVIFNTKDMAACIQGIYPSLPDCIKKIKSEGVKGIAFSRRFALTKNDVFKWPANLIYKTVGIVGKLDKAGMLHLLPKYEYLNSVLMEVVGDQCYAGVLAE